MLQLGSLGPANGAPHFVYKEIYAGGRYCFSENVEGRHLCSEQGTNEILRRLTITTMTIVTLQSAILVIAVLLQDSKQGSPTMKDLVEL